jgi:hypothetical protein
MGAPIFIDSLVLTLGRFIRKRYLRSAADEGRMKNRIPKTGTSNSALITLSTGQMLLPEIGAPYQFLK